MDWTERNKGIKGDCFLAWANKRMDLKRAALGGTGCRERIVVQYWIHSLRCYYTAIGNFTLGWKDQGASESLGPITVMRGPLSREERCRGLGHRGDERSGKLTLTTTCDQLRYMFNWSIFALVLIRGWSILDLFLKTVSIPEYTILNGDWVIVKWICLFLKYLFEIFLPRWLLCYNGGVRLGCSADTRHVTRMQGLNWERKVGSCAFY